MGHASTRFASGSLAPGRAGGFACSVNTLCALEEWAQRHAATHHEDSCWTPGRVEKLTLPHKLPCTAPQPPTVGSRAHRLALHSAHIGEMMGPARDRWICNTASNSSLSHASSWGGVHPGEVCCTFDAPILLGHIRSILEPMFVNIFPARRLLPHILNFPNWFS